MNSPVGILLLQIVCAMTVAASAASAVARDYVVAQVAAFTGAQASSGKAIRAGIRLYFDQVNRTALLGADRIKLVTRDDEYRADETVRLVKEVLEQDQPIALIGALGTANIEALIKDGVLTKTNIPLVGAISGASSMIGAPNVFVTKASYRDEVDQLFELIARSGQDRAAVVHQNDSLGKDVLASAEQSAPRHRMTLTVKTSYERNTTKVEPAVQAVLKSDAQVVYLAAVTSAAIEFIKQYRASGGAAQIFGLSIIDVEALLRALGPELARGYAFGALQPVSTSAKYAIVREYRKLRANSTDRDLAERSLEGFIAAKTLVAALRQSRAQNSAALIKGLAGLKGVDLGDYFIDFTRPDRTGSRFVEFAIISRNGRIEH